MNMKIESLATFVPQNFYFVGLRCSGVGQPKTKMVNEKKK